MFIVSVRAVKKGVIPRKSPADSIKTGDRTLGVPCLKPKIKLIEAMNTNAFKS